MVLDISNIDRRWIDVEFPADPNFVPGDLRPSEDAMRELCAAMPAYEDRAGIIESSRWKELADYIDANGGGNENLIAYILNQSREGSCVGNAGTQAQMIRQGLQFGKHNITKMSAISLYQLIGRSPNSGAMVNDAMDELLKTGIIPLDTPENRAIFGDIVMPPTGFYTRRPSGWQAVAEQFRMLEYNVIQTYEGLMSAGLRGEPIVVGRAGHSICYLRPKYEGNTPYYLYVNSWSEDWGFGLGGYKGGFGLDSQRLMRSSAGWAFTIRSVTVPNHLKLAA